MDTEILIAEVFEPVADRVKRKAESLKHLRRFERCGIEGWFKVEAVAALGLRVKKIQNEGPDLLLRDGYIELKAATDCNTSYILEALTKFPNTPCLFLGSSDNIRIHACVERLKKGLDNGSRMVAHETFSDENGKDCWIVGLIVPAD
jgi:hypothetical protein